MTTQQLLAEGLVPTPGKRVRRPGLHALTGVRFFAAFWVMTFHFGAAFTVRIHLPHPVTVFTEHGNLGVALFFMLSGFILYYTYEGNLRTPRDLYKFFVARVARLYPVYLFAIAFQCLANRSFPHGRRLLIFPMLQSWVPPLSDFGYSWIIQTWTLSVEAFFYACFPLLILLFRRRWSSLALWSAVAALLVLAVALRTPMIHPGASPPTWLVSHIILPVIRLPEFLLGVLLGVLFLRRQNAALAPGLAPMRGPMNDWLTAAGLLPCVALIAGGLGETLAALGAVAGCAWAIYRLAGGRGWLTALLSTKTMMLLGGASFSIYILQGVWREVARKLFAPLHPGLDAALSPIILIPFCCLLFLYYEEPLRNVVRNLLLPRRS